MKRFIYIFTAAVSALMLLACERTEPVDFSSEAGKLSIGPDGGVLKTKIASDDSWIASTDAPWLTVSPANGRGSVVCEIQVDSTLIFDARTGYIRIENQETWEKYDIEVSQEGYPRIIELAKPEVRIGNFAAFDDRTFTVKVRTNVDFSVEIPENIGWISNSMYSVNLDRGARPREVALEFKWKVNSAPFERNTEVAFKPVEAVSMARQDVLKVLQNAAPEIEAGTRRGDSLALVSISRSLDTWKSWDNPDPMDLWEDVELWEPGMEGYTPEKKGRVKYARFFMFSTKEGLPYEVQYLTEAEELYFLGNENAFMKNLDQGEYITLLPNLKKLTISGYGLTSLSPSFTKLSNLESLEISGNNFQTVPDILTPENFPNLRRLVMNANQRSLIYDLSNTVAKDFGGFYDEEGFPERLLYWDNLETLILSVNYLQGPIPTMENAPKYTAEDVAEMNLPPALIGTPKVLPNTTWLAFNLNRLSGTLPDWILYHPHFNEWNPEVFIYTQEGKDDGGRSAGFTNVPANLNYYFDFYEGYKDRVNIDDNETE